MTVRETIRQEYPNLVFRALRADMAEIAGLELNAQCVVPDQPADMRDASPEQLAPVHLG